MHIIIVFTLLSSLLNASELKINTFGNKTNKPLIFLHGGPGYNSVTFEQTTANELAKNGFYVISYDRRGEGRNRNLKSNYTFKQTFDDLNFIFNTYKIDKAVLLGHSFGGVIASLYAEQNPDKIKSLILLGTPVSMQKTLKNILLKSKEIYTAKNDTNNLKYIAALEKMNSKSLEYSSYCFMHAMSNGFYSTKKPNKKAIFLYSKFKKDTLLKKYASKMGYIAPRGFWTNENYTSISIHNNLKKLKLKKIKVYAIYGKEDGLYSKEQVDNLKTIIGKENLKYLENCSHSIFIDRQIKFIELLKNWTS